MDVNRTIVEEHCEKTVSSCVRNVARRNALGKIEDLYRKLVKRQQQEALLILHEQGLFLRADGWL
ncbi:hypothetical protein ccbrp13_40540 [Ktedonobacteria bacterium brp13]|nr:hypothetical protein ccbrp13_06510 [Ktedonobacteria bacterium brp13]BCL81589.1 hypothetical protein ccbrp13_40540 [Ktedonobacteria bacterium brp13]